MCLNHIDAQSCLTLCNPLDYSLPGSSGHRIFQARILEWVAISSSRGSSLPKDRILVSCISCIAGVFFTVAPPGKPVFIHGDKKTLEFIHENIFH